MPLPPPTPPLPQPPPPGPSDVAVCYRHKDRPTGRQCTRCGKSACNDCLVQAPVGSHCLDCAKAARPDLATRAKFWSAGQHNLVTVTLVGLNIAVFVLVLLWTRDAGVLTRGGTNVHYDFAVGRNVLAFDTAFRSGDEIIRTEAGGWYRLLTSGFLHNGLIHLALNCYFIYVLGPQLERPLGRVQFLLLYLASLFGGSLGVILLDNGERLVFAAGASGAAFGMIAAMAVSLQRRGLNPLASRIGPAIVINLYITFAVPDISIGGHLGGAVAGAICGAVMLSPGHKPVPKWAPWATPVAVGLASIVLSILIVSAA